ncbi:MAG: flagellar biosynthesis regulator FlaF [Methylobacteriaceae bacterium]|nr:flagellar biosynthesis regulator FlaF [Methylobacteriaceae bacterium]
MNQAAASYSRVSQVGLSPREAEAAALIKAAARLQAIQDDWTGRQGELDSALAFNRKLWTIFVSAASAPDAPLPAEVRSNIVNLGMFIFDRTIATLAEPSPDKLGALVNINREVAAGLRPAARAAA